METAMTSLMDLKIDEAVRIHQEGILFLEAGQLESARILLEKSIGLFIESVGPKHPDVANVLNGIGQLAMQQNDFDLARRCYSRSWRICRPIVDCSEDDSIARIAVHAMSNLGNLEREAGNWTQAGSLLRRSVRLARKCLGDNDLDTSIALNMLGMWCKFTGRFELGRKCYRFAMKIQRQHCDSREARRSSEIAGLYHNMGGLEHSARNFPLAERYARNSVAIRRRVIGTSHPDYASDIGGLAAIIADQGRADEAESLYREALKIFEGIYGVEHYEIAVLLHNLAAVEVARERFDSAWELYGQSAKMKERLLGLDHPDLAMTLHNLAVLAYELDRKTIASDYCRQALSIFEKNLVPSHPTLLACREVAAALAIR